MVAPHSISQIYLHWCKVGRGKKMERECGSFAYILEGQQLHSPSHILPTLWAYEMHTNVLEYSGMK